MKIKQPLFWDFEVDSSGNAKEFYKNKLGKDDINKFTKLIKYTAYKTNSIEEVQQVIDKIVNEYNLDKLPLIVFKTLAKSKEQEYYYTEINPLNFNNVSTKENLFLSRYFTTPEHLRVL